MGRKRECVHGVFGPGCHDCRMERGVKAEEAWGPRPGAAWGTASGAEIVAEITAAKEKIWSGRLEPGDYDEERKRLAKEAVERGVSIIGAGRGSDTGEITYTHSGPPMTLSSGDSVTYGTGTYMTSSGPISSGSISVGGTTSYALSPLSVPPKVVVVDHNGNALDLGDMVAELSMSYDRMVAGAMAATVTLKLREGVTCGKTPDKGFPPLETLTFRDETEFDAIRMSGYLYDPDDYDPEDGSEL